MKDFLKFMAATVVGIIVASVLMFFLGTLSLVGMAASSESETMVEENSVFMIELNGMVSERSVDNPLASIMGETNASIGLSDLLASIKKAKENENIKGIYLQGSAMLSAGYASLEAIHNALKDFKESGKFIVAYADIYSQGEYYLASVADKVLLNPSGMIQWNGLSAQPMFFKDLLEKVGVEMQIFKVGTYKSAVEPFIATEMSDANREQITAYLGSIWQTMTSDIAANRGISVEQLNQLADKMMMLQPAQENVAGGLADTLIYKNDVRNYLKKMVGIDEDDKLNVIGLSGMKNVKKTQPKDPSGNIIAVYYAEGEIVDEVSASAMGGEASIVGNEVISDLRKLKDDEDVKAVVLRVNSPGGSAFASEQMWYAISELKKEKPVIVSMGDYAASGGYYISCNADTIVAEPTTITGSIGIFGMFPSVGKLVDKVGLNFDVVKTNTYADFGDLTRPMSDGEKALMQANVERGYDLFLTRCADGRGMTKEAIDKIGQGRVWTGSMALELGLVDVLGGIDTALDIAIQKAGVEAYTVQNYPGEKSFFETLMESTSNGVDNYIKTRIMGKKLNEMSKPFYLIDEFDKVDRLQARMPYVLNFQ